ncbi:MAG: hypothetical protein M3198_19495 [Actinomycetota bacterium]|nr:hypothetical protein [Actinomycetota bacterium]
MSGDSGGELDELVLDFKSDASGDIKETNESDNRGYALLRIVDHEIRVLERGYGSHPSDPKKMVERDDTLPGTG